MWNLSDWNLFQHLLDLLHFLIQAVVDPVTVEHPLEPSLALEECERVLSCQDPGSIFSDSWESENLPSKSCCLVILLQFVVVSIRQLLCIDKLLPTIQLSWWNWWGASLKGFICTMEPVPLNVSVFFSLIFQPLQYGFWFFFKINKHHYFVIIELSP